MRPAMIEQRINTPGQVLFASLIGTTIEFFDFYIYATAAVLVFPAALLSGLRPCLRDPGVARNLCHRLSRPAARIGALRTLR